MISFLYSSLDFFCTSVSCTFCMHFVMLVGGLEYSVAINSVAFNEDFCCHVTNLFGVMFVCVCVFVSILQ
jgi:hypothetical protein